MTALAARGLEKRFGARAALDGVDLDVGDGELVVVVGPSGCGKSTLLRVLAGIVGPDAGTVHVAGVDVSASPPERRRVGLVFQDHALFPHLDVRANVAFGVPGRRAARHARAEELLGLVRLGTLARRYPHELSGGEQQRVALARTLAADPAVVLLDEPFASLDPDLRPALREDVVAVLRERRVPAVLVTHDRDEALALADRVVVLREGRVEQAGPPAEVHARPRTRFVARFLGEASFVPAVADGDRWWTPLGPAAVEAPSGSGPCEVLVRPHDVEVRPCPGNGIVTARRFVDGRALVDIRVGTVHAVRVADGVDLRLRDDLRVVDHVDIRGWAPPTIAIGDRVDVHLVAPRPLVPVPPESPPVPPDGPIPA